VKHVVDDVPEVVEYVPAEQRVQELEPSSVEYEPMQGEQVVAPYVDEYLPTGHRTHEDADDAPVDVENVPGLQGIQVVDPALDE
jgi:hypothetical protein